MPASSCSASRLGRVDQPQGGDTALAEELDDLVRGASDLLLVTSFGSEKSGHRSAQNTEGFVGSDRYGGGSDQ